MAVLLLQVVCCRVQLYRLVEIRIVGNTSKGGKRKRKGFSISYDSTEWILWLWAWANYLYFPFSVFTLPFFRLRLVEIRMVGNLPSLGKTKFQRWSAQPLPISWNRNSWKHAVFKASVLLATLIFFLYRLVEIGIVGNHLLAHLRLPYGGLGFTD